MSYLKTVYGERKPTTYPDKFCEHIMKKYNLKHNQKFLDVGCGSGVFADAFKKKGFHVQGIDREKFWKYTRRIKDLETSDFPYPNNSFNVVFSKSVIEHIHKPEHFLSECKRVLKKGGRLIILVPDWITQQNVFYEDYTHVQPYTITSMNDLLKIHGFKNVQVELFTQLPVIWKYKYLEIFSKILRIFLKPNLKRFENEFIRWSIELMVLGTATK